MSIDVFISYNHEDFEIAELLCNLLEGKGITTWMAPRDILVGSNYAQEIYTAIKKASVFSVLIGTNSCKSFHVKNEIELASRQIQRGMLILPILLDKEVLDEEIQYYLSRQQWLDASTPPIQISFEKYCNSIKELLGTRQKSSDSENQQSHDEPYIGRAKNASDQRGKKSGNIQEKIEQLKDEINKYGSPKKEFDGEYTQLLMHLAGLYFSKDDFQTAIDIYAKAMDSAPDHVVPSIYSEMGSVYEASRNWEKAIDCFTEALTHQRIEFGQYNPVDFEKRRYAYFRANSQKEFEMACIALRDSQKK